jgi:hypothetical protein
MKQFILMLLMMTCSLCWATWEVVSGTDNYYVMVDKATKRKKGVFVEIWEMKNYFLPQQDTGNNSFSSVKVLKRYDCVNETVGLISLAQYSESDGGGQVVWTGTRKKHEIEDVPVVPESVGATIWKIACDKK